MSRNLFRKGYSAERSLLQTITIRNSAAIVADGSCSYGSSVSVGMIVGAWICLNFALPASNDFSDLANWQFSKQDIHNEYNSR